MDKFFKSRFRDITLIPHSGQDTWDETEGTPFIINALVREKVSGLDPAQYAEGISGTIKLFYKADNEVILVGDEIVGAYGSYEVQQVDERRDVMVGIDTVIIGVKK